MALRYFIGMEAGEPNLSSAAFSSGWYHEINNYTNSSGGTVALVRNNSPHSGHYFLRIQATSTTNGALGAQPAEQAISVGTAYYTFWFRVPSYPSGDTNMCILQSTNGRLVMSAAGDLTFQRYDGGWITVASALAISTNAWHRIDISIVNGNLTTNNSGEFKFDGVSVGTYGPLTRSSGNGSGDILLGPGIGAGSTGTTFTFEFDDLICDDAAFIATDAGVVRMLPNAAGNYTAWTGGFGKIDDYAPSFPAVENGDSITATTVGDKGSYGLESATASLVGGTIYGVQPFAIARRTSGAFGDVGTFIRSGSTDTASNQEDLTSETTGGFKYVTGDTITLDPADSTAWTSAKLDALEVGIESMRDVSAKYVDILGVMVLCSAPVQASDLLLVPSITSVTPNNGPKAGSTAITIAGINFTGTTSVKIGGVACTSVSVVSDISVTCTTASISKAGTYNLEMINGDGLGVLTSAYTYTPGNSGGNGGNNTTGAVASVVVTVPSSPSGNVMFAFITVRVTTTTVTQASWGTEVTSRSDGTNAITRVFRRVSAGSEPGTYTFTLGTAQKASGVIISTPDVDTATTAYQITSQANASSVNIVAPTLTPRRLGSVSIHGAGTAVGTTIAPSSSPAYTEPAGADSASTGGSAATRTTTEGSYRTLTSVSATGTVTAVASAAATNSGFQVMLDPPGVIDLPLIDQSGVVYAPTLSGAAPVSSQPFSNAQYAQLLPQ